MLGHTTLVFVYCICVPAVLFHQKTISAKFVLQWPNCLLLLFFFFFFYYFFFLAETVFGSYETAPIFKYIPVLFFCFTYSISNVFVTLGILKQFCIARFTQCQNVRNTPADSSNLSNYYLTLAQIEADSHTLWYSTYKCLSSSTTYLQVGVWRVCYGSEHRHGFDRSISG